MAVAASSSSSSSSSSSILTLVKHEVFLSFAGQDTRAKFTSHLHAKLMQKNIDTYIDYRLSKGDEISQSLIKAIQASRISIIIFSENYAFSTWCLNEVLCILECKKENRQIIAPVFYDVDPSHVRYQLKSYEKAFAKHRERYKDRMEKVDKWRAALTEVASISGWDSRTYKGTEAEFIEEIVKDILMKLNRMTSSDDEVKDLVGINKNIEEMEQLLCIHESLNVRFIGVCGMGGIGKTTLARVIFQRLSSKFQGSCFVENVREESGKCDGLKGLEKKLFSELLEENDIHTITSFHKKRLRCKKVLVVLDDVDDPKQLEVLGADHDWFGPGSRIILTTRDASMLRDKADQKYELKGLGFDDAFQLLNMNIHKKSHTPTTDDDVVLLNRVVEYANGSPLALKVLGSFLRSKNKENWIVELTKLKEFPNERIHSVLKISFDALDETEKDIFLDIVCLLRIELSICRKIVKHRLSAHRSYVDIGMESLIDKSLITVKDNKVMVHDLLRDMGRKIVRHQNIEEPGQRTRLWNEKDVFHVLKNKIGTPTIEGICCHIMEHSRDCNPTLFGGMHRLWLLDISWSNLDFPQGLQYLPDSLKCLIWPSWPWKSLPSNYMPHNLVELRMPHSMLEQLWSGRVQDLGNLKYVDLSNSHYLTEISALCQAPNLVSVDLTHCTRLFQVPSLRFQICHKLTSLDQSYNECDHNDCQTLGQLKLNDCSKLEVVENMSGNLRELDLSSTSLKQVPLVSSIEKLTLYGCKGIKILLNSICKLKSLKTLDLGCCDELELFQSILDPLEHLETLKMERSGIRALPSLASFHFLTSLDLKLCKGLKSLPDLPLSLKLLDARGCVSLETMSNTRDAVIQRLRSDNHAMTCRKFLYADCLKLDRNTRDNILIEFQLRTLDTSIKSVLSHGRLKKAYYPGVGICYPGYSYDIPKWFTNQSRSSSVSVKLSPNWLNTNFLGFALCTTGNLMALKLCCEANFKISNAKSSKCLWDFPHVDIYSRPPEVLINSSNIFMWYKHENYQDYSDAVDVSFHFYDETEERKVTACGIRLLYRQDAEELGITNKPVKSML